MDSLISSSGSLKSSGTTSRPSSCPALGTPVTGGPILFGPKDALCRSYTKGSSCVSGAWRDQQFHPSGSDPAKPTPRSSELTSSIGEKLVLCKLVRAMVC